MKHVGESALARIELRTIEGPLEKRPGVFCRGSAAFLHFMRIPRASLPMGALEASGSGWR